MLTVAMGKLTDEVRWDCPQKGTFADDVVGTGEMRPRTCVMRGDQVSSQGWRESGVRTSQLQHMRCF